jgi:gliding motility-associated-like protein
MRSKFFYILLCSLQSIFAVGQPTSYVRELTFMNGDSMRIFFSVGADSDDGSFAFPIRFQDGQFELSGYKRFVMEIDSIGGIKNMFGFKSQAIQDPSNVPDLHSVDRFQSNLLFSYYGIDPLDSLKFVLFMLNPETGNFWGKQFYPDRVDSELYWKRRFRFSRSGHTCLVSYRPEYDDNFLTALELNLACLYTQTGEPSFQYAYKPLGLVPISDIYFNTINPINEDGFAIMGTYYDSQFKSFLLQIDSIGNPLNSISIPININEYPLSIEDQVMDHDGNTIIAGRIIKSSFPNHDFSMYIAKFDTAFQLVWAKELLADYFPCYWLSLGLFSDNRIQFTYHSDGDLPTIVGQLSESGELLTYQGLALGYNYPNPKKDGGVFFTHRHKFNSDGNREHALIVAYLDTTGIIAGCPQVEACLDVLDFTLIYESLQWERSAITPPWTAEVSYQSFDDFISNPFCQTSTPADPYFNLPDTICVGSFVQPTGLQNRTANHVEWHIQGVGLDSLIADTTFSVLIDLPGTYQVSQEVWLLGCNDFFEREIVVLPNLEFEFNTEGVICEETPFELSVLASRPVQSYLWSDGAITPSIMVNEEGSYAVTISDAYCDTVGTIDIQFPAAQLAEAVIQLPNDTIICLQELPYTLEVSSPYTSTFLNVTTNVSGNVFTLSSPGNYIITTEVEGCPFQSVFLLATDLCLGNIYLPNSFSPNGDGTNDNYEAFGGADILVTRMTVYDRWGGVLYSNSQLPIRWDGTFKGEAVVQGVYLVIVEYKNLYTGALLSEGKDVLVLR